MFRFEATLFTFLKCSGFSARVFDTQGVRFYDFFAYDGADDIVKIVNLFPSVVSLFLTSLDARARAYILL